MTMPWYYIHQKHGPAKWPVTKRKISMLSNRPMGTSSFINSNSSVICQTPRVSGDTCNLLIIRRILFRFQNPEIMRFIDCICWSILNVILATFFVNMTIGGFRSIAIRAQNRNPLQKWITKCCLPVDAMENKTGIVINSSSQQVRHILWQVTVV